MADNWNMLGHEWAVDMLHQQVAHGEARHAYLFCGPPGLGIPLAYLWLRVLLGNPLDVTNLSFPRVDPFLVVVVIFFAAMLCQMQKAAGERAREPPHVEPTRNPDYPLSLVDDVNSIAVFRSPHSDIWRPRRIRVGERLDYRSIIGRRLPHP